MISKYKLELIFLHSLVAFSEIDLGTLVATHEDPVTKKCKNCANKSASF